LKPFTRLDLKPKSCFCAGRGTWIWPNGNSYSGEYINGTKHGLGRTTDPSGTIYSGEFANDLPNGKGRLEFTNKTIFEATFKNGLFDGNVTTILPSGLSYTQTYTMGVRDNVSYYYFKGPRNTSATFEGRVDFNANFANGKGSLKGEIYEGSYIYRLLDLSARDASFRRPDFYLGYETDGMSDQGILGFFKFVPHGNGSYESRFVKYVGGFNIGNFDGCGSFIFLEPFDYFSAGMAKLETCLDHSRIHGETRVIYTDGKTFQGHFNNGLRQGKGSEMNIEEGYIYNGDYKNGLKHGNGSITYSTSLRYEGEFKKDKVDGVGNLTTSDGLQYFGNVTSNGTEFYGRFSDSKKTYEGEILHGQMHGFGTLWMTNGDVYQGQFSHQYFDGFGVYKFANGITYIGYFRNGDLNGFGFFV
jgi:hypothetical protein